MNKQAGERVRIERVNKHADHGSMTLFRVFVGGELVAGFRVPDEAADYIEGLVYLDRRDGCDTCGLNGTSIGVCAESPECLSCRGYDHHTPKEKK